MQKDETKEILNRLVKYLKESNINDFGYEQDKLISYEEAQIILDYITNLQESEAYYYGQYKDYKSRIDKAKEYINHEIFKRTILVGVGTKKYTRNILDNVLNILNGGDE